MSRDNSATATGIGVPWALAITFTVLKLCGVIDWNWFWIAAPLWGPVALFLGFALLMFAAYFTCCGVRAVYRRTRRPPKTQRAPVRSDPYNW
jgi:hypothetical protein